MRQMHRGLTAASVAIGALTVGLFVTDGDALAQNRRKAKAANVNNLLTPLGLQGTRGAGNEVVTAFQLVDRSRRKTDLDVEYGVDRNNDGQIADGETVREQILDPNTGEVIGEGDILPSEYLPTTEDRRDPRNTRKNKGSQLFTTAAGIGAAHAFVWNSSADIESSNFPTVQILFTQDGRPVPDPDNPGGFQFADTQPGVRLRIRASKGKGKKAKVGDWQYSEAFALNNNTPPSMTIDAVIPNTTSNPVASDEVVDILWSAFDDDSEDKNANGALDPLDLEDRNGNGLLDSEPVAVAFDYYRVGPGEDPTSMTPAELAALLWSPCTNDIGSGDSNTGAPSAPSDAVPADPLDPANQHTFSWDSVADVGTVNANFILRARPFDEKLENGEFVYFETPFTLDNWKIFNTGGPGAVLPGGRVGASVVNLTPNLAQSDGAYNPPLQSFLVTGGSSVVNGPGTNYLAVMIVNTETSETATANAAPFVNLLEARSHHTSTVLDDGRVLIAGGFGAGGLPLATTEIYDPLTHQMEPGPTFATARANQTAVLLGSGNVAFFGGIGNGGAPLASCEIYRFSPAGDPASPIEALPSLGVAQHSAHAILLPDLTVLVTGGIGAGDSPVQTAQVLNPLHDDDPADPTTKNPRFEAAGAMATGRKHGSATGMLNGHVLFAGGAASPATATMEVFNYLTRAFEGVSIDMEDGGRAQHVAALLGDGSILLAGGTSDPDTGALLSTADVVRITGRDSGTGIWSAISLAVNGDMKTPRRLASSVVINNSRVFIVGGLNATGGSIAEMETYTPEGGRNSRPSARTDLESQQQSWAFGAPIVYRLTDVDLDPARVIVQWSKNGGINWNSAAPQASTIGGDVAEPAAGRSTGAADDQTAGINPRAIPQSDHQYIWGMNQDIPRPPPGGSDGPYIFRTIPFGAVRGDAAQSVPVTVLFNTKVIPTVIAFEDPTGSPDINQGGDISIFVHLRDIDGTGPFGPNGGRIGDPGEAVFEYAVDANNDGIINDGQEFWNAMSQSTAGIDPSQQGASRLVGLTTWSEAPDHISSGNIFGQRLPENGWAQFFWDSVYDLGAPASSVGNVFIRVRPFDNLISPTPDEGFTATVFNEPGQAEKLRIVRHPDALWLKTFAPAGNNSAAVSVNEALVFTFNGIVDASTVNSDTIQITRNATQILGVYVTEANVPANETVITFFPLANSTVNDAPVFAESDAQTVLFPFNTYDVTIPGYAKQSDPTLGLTLRPVGWLAQTRTHLIAQNVPIAENFTTIDGNFDDGTLPVLDSQFPVQGTTLASDGGGAQFSLNTNVGIDIGTVKSPDITVRVDNAQNSVIPGRWTVTNTQDPLTGAISGVMTFTPLFKLPSGVQVFVQTNGSPLSLSGSPLSVDTNYTVDAFGRQDVTITESFANADQRDTANTTAIWGTDPCDPGALTGVQDGNSQPTGGNDLTITSGNTLTISAAVNQYNNITVEKGGTLRIRQASSTVTVLAQGDVTIAGTVDFSGEPGDSGHFGNTSTSVSGTWYFTSRAVGTRDGGKGFNGAGSGGKSENTSTSPFRKDGVDGTGPEGGEGGNMNTLNRTGSSYRYGSGGGAGGGHGTAGIAGGAASNFGTSTLYGPQSVPGGTKGEAEFLTGVTGGDGGGGGGTHRYSSTWYAQGGGGGSGAGGVTFVVDGKFELKPSGLINGRGGSGGASVHHAGSGGGGAGGGLHVKAGGDAILDGLIDLRGGQGGPANFGYYSDFYTGTPHFSRGTLRHGGDGGLGRCRIEAGNLGDFDEVRIFGQLMTKKIQALPTPSVGAAVAAPAAFTNGGTVAFGATAEVRYTSLNIPAGRVVDMTGTAAVKIFVDGPVNIDGTLRVNGARPVLGYTGATEFDGSSGINTTFKAGTGVFGGGAGGDSYNNTAADTKATHFRRQGKDGNGPSKGLNKDGTNSGYTWSSRNLFNGDSGASGAGGAGSAGGNGWAPYSTSGRYSYAGAVTDTTGNGRTHENVALDQANGGAALDPSTLTVANLANFVGSGGGGGNNGGYSFSTNRDVGHAGSGGGGAGAFAIIGSGTVDIGGTIEARGGDGNPGGAAFSSRITQWNWNTGQRANVSYAHSAGGAGSGGTVYILGDEVTIDAVTVGEGGGADGATFDMRGGMGGGWRQKNNRGGVSARYPTYNSQGSFGGDGGFGLVSIDYTTSLNDGATLANKWGLQQSVFKDTFQRWDAALAGSASFVCRGVNGGGTFQSDWYDLGSISPDLTSASFGFVGPNTTHTVQVQGAQSHPHNPGAGGTGEPDSNVVSSLIDPSNTVLSGWRWTRFTGTLSRTSTDSTLAAPVLDDFNQNVNTDQ